MRKNRTIVPLILLMLLAVAPTGCGLGDEQAEGEETISPATPPGATTQIDEDPALTQTVEIGEDRSPNEGGILTDPDYEAPPEELPSETTTTRSEPPGTE